MIKWSTVFFGKNKK